MTTAFPRVTSLVLGFAVFSIELLSAQPKLPDKDQRGGAPRTLNTLRTFPEIASKETWQARAKSIREQVLVSCGLWPLPEKAPLKPVVFDRVERDGYSIEKVYIQTYPGFYLAGNLYRPLGKGNGPFPGVLNPHGHWKNGRLADEPLGSIAARCISFARQGMVAFTYDMAGYNDTAQVSHKFAANPTNQLWNISLMGLQTWNSIRALDFLETLPDVDKQRLACTGESGGGTQTFMLGAIDSRPAVLAPIVMVSHSMQGGCLCENAPGLRVRFSNMELAAAAAPRPQILVGATGDWTKKTMEVEGPSIEKVYRLFNAGDNLRYRRFEFDHNYNQTSREAVYQFFGRWLLQHPAPDSLTELPYKKEPDADLLVFGKRERPADALNETQLVDALIRQAKAQFDAHSPAKTSLADFKSTWLPAWKATLQLDDAPVIFEAREALQVNRVEFEEFAIGRAGRGDRIPVTLLVPRRNPSKLTVILAHPDGKKAFLDQPETGLAQRLLKERHTVLLVDVFGTGSLTGDPTNTQANYFSTYNRTVMQERVQDLLTAAEFARTRSKDTQVALVGVQAAGAWAMLAAPGVDIVVADGAGLARNDEQLMTPEIFVPGLHRLGTFEGVAALAAPNPLLFHNTRVKSASGVLARAYPKRTFEEHSQAQSDANIAKWISKMASR